MAVKLALNSNSCVLRNGGLYPLLGIIAAFGCLSAVVMANAAGAWDNAKK
ncbi:Inorganic H+ pyrophosphatase [Methylobacter tundripaludum]|uniref:Inorganic H+ pyrophosphatase n=1 Tax=Methylobacter tundripaludum TaxID=173365 RepID=A0A2S6GVQ4_9GAMM|nr:Inorganic H+ pyrophosphatase [Methylobacter tundripaludum]